MSLEIHEQRKRIEEITHDQIFDYLTLLQHLYQPTEDFTRVFKKNMFVNHNRIGFQQTIYYVLMIFDPNQIKKKIMSWPIWDSKIEIHFRKEVLTYINEISTMYPDACIPKLMASHLLSPGKYKFAQMMLSIIQVVSSKVLNEDAIINNNGFDETLQLPKTSDNIKQNELIPKHLEMLTLAVENETLDCLQEYSSFKVECELEASKNSEEWLLIKEEILQLEKTLEELQIEKIEEVSGSKINSLECDVEVIQEIANKFSHASKLLLDLKGYDCYLQGDPGNKLNLLEHFANMLQTFCSKINNVAKVSAKDMDGKIRTISQIIEDYEVVLDKFPLIRDKMKSFLNEMETTDLFEKTLQPS